MQYELALDYSLASGWMTPFVDGLRGGIALASQCANCQKTSFPPSRVCACGSADAEWAPLSGQAAIDWRTDGADGAFALVTFDGAETRSVVRLEGLGPDDTHGQLIAPKTDIPQLILGPIEKQNHGN